MTGAQFRKKILARWKLTDPELAILDQAAATLDIIAEVESSGMPLNERARELRAQRIAFGKLINQLALPDEDGGRVASTTHNRARKAANARWGT